jgi:putative protease
MNLREITAVTSVAKKHDVLTEVFVHGSLCVAFSGLCYSTSASVGNSGNRGRCSQACREEYETTPSGNNFPLNIKDNSAFFDLPELIDAGVHSFKVEGRIKGASYVHTVIDSFRKQIDGYLETGKLLEDGERLYKVFNRDLTNSFLRGDLNQSMFIENPRDNSKYHAVDQSNAISVVQIHEVEQKLSHEKTQINIAVNEKIKHLSIEKRPLALAFTGEINKPLTLTAITQEYIKGKTTTKEKQIVIQSNNVLVASDKSGIDKDAIIKRFKSFNNSQFHLTELNLDGIPEGMSIPFKNLTTLKNELTSLLNNNAPIYPEVILPKLTRHPKKSSSEYLNIERNIEKLDGETLSNKAKTNDKVKLSILICDESDIALTNVTDSDIYFKLPDAYKRGCTKYISFFKENPRLIPWFPSVLIGKDFDVALNILEQVKPELIITNNTGVANRAYELGIKWIAGPFLNTTNSYALLAMKESFDCEGAFISNEINHQQMKTIARPENFKLFYSIYHPILLMTSRQCFFQQSVGCEKPRIDNGCMLSCDKSTSITNLKGVSFAIDKQKAGYPSIYNNDQFLNMEIINDLASLYDGFMIDLTNIGAGDKESPDKAILIEQFEKLLKVDKNNSNNSIEQSDKQPTIKETLSQLVPESTNVQYYNGL